MYCNLNVFDKYGKSKKTNYANQLGLTKPPTNVGYVYFCGSNNRMNSSNNTLMQHVWNPQKRLQLDFKFKDCVSNVYYDNGDSYYLITQNGDMYVGGENHYRCLGYDDSSSYNSFQHNGSNWKKVAVRTGVGGSNPTVYFLSQDGSLYFSGRQGYAYYNGNYCIKQNVIQQFDQSGVRVQDVCAFYGGSLILDKDGYIWAKGYNRDGQLGNGLSGANNDNQRQRYYIKIAVPNKVAENNWVKIAAGWNTCYALNSKGQLYAWGSNEYGQLGIGSNDSLKSIPQLVGNGELLFDDISAGYNHMICKDIQGNIYTAGYNYYGSLGDGTTVNKNILTKVFSNINARRVYAGERGSAIIDVYGGCYCVGYSNNTIINGYVGNVLQWTKLGYVNNITHITMCRNSFCLIGE